MVAVTQQQAVFMRPQVALAEAADFRTKAAQVALAEAEAQVVAQRIDPAESVALAAAAARAILAAQAALAEAVERILQRRLTEQVVPQ